MGFLKDYLGLQPSATTCRCCWVWWNSIAPRPAGRGLGPIRG